MALVVACAIAIAPSVAPPPHTSAERAVTLVAETQPVVVRLVAGQGLDDLTVTAAYDSVRPSLDYGAALALWAGRFLPIPGAALYHSSVAYETLVDPTTYSLVHNFGAFIGGDIELAVALKNIAVDAIGAVVDFATTELNGHAAVVPPTDAPAAGVEPWVRWIITAAVSPLYYLPVPNALTVDQVSILGWLVGTMVSSAIDNLGEVVAKRLTLGQALTNLWVELTDVALPKLAAQERGLFLPPARPAGGVVDPSLALANRIATIDGAAPLLAADAAAPMALVPTLHVQEERSLSGGPVGVGAKPVEVESEPATAALASTRAEVPEALSDSPSSNEALSRRTAVEQEPSIRAEDRSPEKVKLDKKRRLAEGTSAPLSAKVPSTRLVKPTADRPESAGVTTKTDIDEGHGTDGSTTQGEAAA